MKEYSSKGMICVRGKNKLIYALCSIEYEYYGEDMYRFIFTPNYSVMDLLSSDVFQGIPGLNLDLRKKEYIRENMVPTFIAERVPQESREDYYELLSLVNMDYMDPIEYLIKTKMQYSGDKLFVIPYFDKDTLDLDEYSKYNNNNDLIKKILENICLGNNITINNQVIDDTNRQIFHDVFIKLYLRSKETKKEIQNIGIKQAQRIGKYKGRKPIKVDIIKFQEILEQVENKKIRVKEATKLLGISVDKYYRLKKELQR